MKSNKMMELISYMQTVASIGIAIPFRAAITAFMTNAASNLDQMCDNCVHDACAAIAGFTGCLLELEIEMSSP